MLHQMPKWFGTFHFRCIFPSALEIQCFATRDGRLTLRRRTTTGHLGRFTSNPPPLREDIRPSRLLRALSGINVKCHRSVCRMRGELRGAKPHNIGCEAYVLVIRIVCRVVQTRKTFRHHQSAHQTNPQDPEERLEVFLSARI